MVVVGFALVALLGDRSAASQASRLTGATTIASPGRTTVFLPAGEYSLYQEFDLPAGAGAPGGTSGFLQSLVPADVTVSMVPASQLRAPAAPAAGARPSRAALRGVGNLRCECPTGNASGSTVGIRGAVCQCVLVTIGSAAPAPPNHSVHIVSSPSISPPTVSSPTVSSPTVSSPTVSPPTVSPPAVAVPVSSSFGVGFGNEGMYTASVGFDAPAAGRYTITVRGNQTGTVVVAATLQRWVNSVSGIAAGIAAGAIVALAGAVLLVVGLVGRRRRPVPRGWSTARG
jgi:hypothetical protein